MSDGDLDPDALVLDTCIVSFLFKQDTRATLYESDLVDKLLVISPMTVAELERWTLVRNWGTARRHALQEYLRQYIVHPFTVDLCREWARVTQVAQNNGHTVNCADAWVAAVATLQDVPLVTNNANDFRGITGLSVISYGDDGSVRGWDAISN